MAKKKAKGKKKVAKGRKAALVGNSVKGSGNGDGIDINEPDVLISGNVVDMTAFGPEVIGMVVSLAEAAKENARAIQAAADVLNSAHVNQVGIKVGK
jgi:hypothetical protein